jgi:hypothetical protein
LKRKVGVGHFLRSEKTFSLLKKNKVQCLIIDLTKFNSEFSCFPKPPFKVQKAFCPDKPQIAVSADRKIGQLNDTRQSQVTQQDYLIRGHTQFQVTILMLAEMHICHSPISILKTTKSMGSLVPPDLR